MNAAATRCVDIFVREVKGGCRRNIEQIASRGWAVRSIATRQTCANASRGVRWASTNTTATGAVVEKVKLDEAQSHQQSDSKRPLSIRLPLAIALTLLSFGAGFTLTGSPSFPSLLHLTSPPSDSDTLRAYQPTNPTSAAIEAQLQAHPLTKSLLADPKFIAARPHLKIPPALRAQNLVAGILSSSPQGIAVPPLQFSTADGSSFVQLAYLGPALTGHPGIVHGGVLATLLDEGLARCCFPALPNKVGVTAWLRVDYKKPVEAGQIIVLRAETTKVEGRKAWVKGRIEKLPEEGKDEKPQVLAEAEALFVEPRQAKHMRRVVT